MARHFAPSFSKTATLNAQPEELKIEKVMKENMEEIRRKVEEERKQI